MRDNGSSAERARVLELLEKGTITAAEAADLLNALGGGEERGRRERGRWGMDHAVLPDRPRWFRVRVSNARSGEVHANVAIPIGVVDFGLNVASRFRGRTPNQVDAIAGAIRANRRGTIFDVAGRDGQRVEIIIE